MIVVFAIFVIAGIAFPRVFTYLIAAPICGFIAGGAIWSMFGLMGYIPGTLNAFIYCVIGGTIGWGLLFLWDRSTQ